MTKVLYVEDNDDNIYMMKMQFELLEGFEFLTAEDVNRAMPRPRPNCQTLS